MAEFVIVIIGAMGLLIWQYYLPHLTFMPDVPTIYSSNEFMKKHGFTISPCNTKILYNGKIIVVMKNFKIYWAYDLSLSEQRKFAKLIRNMELDFKKNRKK